MGNTRPARKGLIGETSYFKDIMYNTFIGRVILTGSVITGVVLAYDVIETYLVSGREPVQQMQVIGGEEADVFIERGGVKYFSHIDGKEISDLLE